MDKYSTKLMGLDKALKLRTYKEFDKRYRGYSTYAHNVKESNPKPFTVGDIVKLSSGLGDIGVIEEVFDDFCTVSLIEKDKLYGYSKTASDLDYSFDAISLHPNTQLVRRIKKDLILESPDIALLKWLNSK